MSRLAIVILNYNGRRFLENFLPGVLRCSDGNPVFIIDNASSDDSLEYLHSDFPEVRIISLSENEGFAGGYNKGLQSISAEYYALLNSDVEVVPGWLEPLIAFMDSHPDCAICQPKILSFHNKHVFEYAGAAGGFIDKYGYPFCRGRIFNAVEKDEHQYDDSREIFWATGACMMVRAGAFHEAGGFDADFFAHMEEIDLCWRLKKAGWKVFYVGPGSVYHVGGGTLPKNNPRKTYLNFRNNLTMLIKNLDTDEIYTVLPARIVLDFVAALKFLVFDTPGDAWAVMKAMWKALSAFPETWKKRKNIPVTYANKNISGIYKKSLVKSYFFKKQKQFSKLDFPYDQ